MQSVMKARDTQARHCGNATSKQNHIPGITKWRTHFRRTLRQHPRGRSRRRLRCGPGFQSSSVELDCNDILLRDEGTGNLHVDAGPQKGTADCTEIPNYHGCRRYCGGGCFCCPCLSCCCSCCGYYCSCNGCRSGVGPGSSRGIGRVGRTSQSRPKPASGALHKLQLPSTRNSTHYAPDCS